MATRLVVGDLHTILHADQRSVLRLAQHFRTASASSPLTKQISDSKIENKKPIFQVTHQQGLIVGKLPTALLSRVEGLLKTLELPFTIEDTRSALPNPTVPAKLKFNIATRPDQVSALQRMLARRCGILKTGNGPANTLAMAALGQALSSSKTPGVVLYCKSPQTARKIHSLIPDAVVAKKVSLVTYDSFDEASRAATQALLVEEVQSVNSSNLFQGLPNLKQCYGFTNTGLDPRREAAALGLESDFGPIEDISPADRHAAYVFTNSSNRVHLHTFRLLLEAHAVPALSLSFARALSVQISRVPENHIVCVSSRDEMNNVAQGLHFRCEDQDIHVIRRPSDLQAVDLTRRGQVLLLDLSQPGPFHLPTDQATNKRPLHFWNAGLLPLHQFHARNFFTGLRPFFVDFHDFSVDVHENMIPKVGTQLRMDSIERQALLRHEASRVFSESLSFHHSLQKASVRAPWNPATRTWKGPGQEDISVYKPKSGEDEDEDNY